MTELRGDEARVADWLGRQYGAMIGLLGDIVTIDSGSYDKEGVDAVAARLEAFFAEQGISTATSEGTTESGNLLRAVVGETANKPPVLLCGHMDTVFPRGEAGRRPFRIDGGRAYGPGVADMKAGLVMNAFVLAAFHHCGIEDAPLVGLFTCDEEIASPYSRRFIEETARGVRAVLNAEPGRVSGNVVIRRKGGVFLRLEVTGKAAHSGANFSDGASAIGELAHKIVALHGLTDIERGTTINVGLVKGGQSVNTTAPHAEGEIDFRYAMPADRAEILAAMERIAERTTVPGTSARLSIRGEFLPFVPTPESGQVFDCYRQTAGDLGFAVDGEATGGCADSGVTAAVGAPTLCATGPVGGKVHTPDEYLEVETIVPRAQAAALTALRLLRA
ncbi:MAG: peptidase M20 [Rhodospirillaceae bacterium]|nr:peptidase M20 [Rhodospirillaceae bacterium]